MNQINSSNLSVLVVEDDQSLSQSIKLNLELAGFPCEVSDSANNAKQVLEHKNFSIVLCDEQLPDVTGTEFITQYVNKYPNSAFILMSGTGNQDIALRALALGAYDYLAKPFSVEELTFLLKKISLRSQTNKTDQTAIDIFKNIVAQSESMQAIFSTVKRIANFNTTVLIQGESGTGKELIAKALHNSSSRSSKPFIAINCGAIPENLIESELFGHKKGSFTDASRDKIGLFEEANGGTIFLDEVGELPLNLQVKLLRVLQEQEIQPVGDEKTKKIDVRIISATHRNLEADIKAGRFRDDLFFRLNVINIKVPSLRERPEDISALVQFFISKYNKKLGTKITGIETEAMQKLISYGWRGNVRELENCIERALVLSEQSKIDVKSLTPQVIADNNSSVFALTSNDNLSIKQHTEAIERKLITKALDHTMGNRTKAATLLEISHRALLYKLKEYGLEGYKKSK